ncbi:MAG: hypothetical protein ACHQQ3_08245 [Gemmatimonadales bacterium]
MDSAFADSWWCGGACADSIDIHYLGVAGFVFRHGAHALVAAPSFTNPPMSASLFSATFLTRWLTPTLESDTALVRRLMGPDTSGIDAVIVGHGHYDHALDLPFVATQVARHASVYGSVSTINMIWGDSAVRADSARMVAIPNAKAGTATTTGDWYYAPGGAFRLMALVADHAPTLETPVGNYLFAAGRYDARATRLPRTAADWRLGQPLAYLIDVLVPGADSVLLRIYYQDAPTTPPLGFPPRAELDRRGVDVAILCVATATHVPSTPEGILAAMHPRGVVGGHWESFFRRQSAPIAINPMSDTGRFARTVLGSATPAPRYWLPRPQQVLSVGIRSRP